LHAPHGHASLGGVALVVGVPIEHQVVELALEGRRRAELVEAPACPAVPVLNFDNVNKNGVTYVNLSQHRPRTTWNSPEVLGEDARAGREPLEAEAHALEVGMGALVAELDRGEHLASDLPRLCTHPGSHGGGD
jgi:hypothetical protein